MVGKRNNRLGGSEYVDRPNRGHKHGYLVRWDARERFLQAIEELAPEVISSLLSAQAIELMLQPATMTRSYCLIENIDPRFERLADLLETVLFDRDDDVFDSVDWTSFDPSSSNLVSQLTESEKDLLTYFGQEGITQICENRRTETVELGVPVWRSVSMGKFSEDDGQIFKPMLRADAPELFKFIRRWSHAWNLDVPWMYMVAFETLLAHINSQNKDEVWSFRSPTHWNDWFRDWRDSWMPLHEQEILITDRWNPRRESVDSVRARLVSMVNAELQRIEARTSMFSETAPSKTNPDHFNWLARFQIHGESINSIAKIVCRSRVTVSDALKQVSELIELPLRQYTRGGRPTK